MLTKEEEEKLDTFCRNHYISEHKECFIDLFHLIFASREAACKEKVREMMELHSHNSIPNYTDEVEEGCVTCVKNKTLESVLSSLEKEL